MQRELDDAKCLWHGHVKLLLSLINGKRAAGWLHSTWCVLSTPCQVEFNCLIFVFFYAIWTAIFVLLTHFGPSGTQSNGCDRRRFSPVSEKVIIPTTVCQHASVKVLHNQVKTSKFFSYRPESQFTICLKGFEDLYSMWHPLSLDFCRGPFFISVKMTGIILIQPSDCKPIYTFLSFIFLFRLQSETYSASCFLFLSSVCYLCSRACKTS